MDVQLPVYLYDVTTASDTPRLVATFCSPDAAQDIAVRLNRMREAGDIQDDPFVVAEPRSDSATITVAPGSSVMVQGYRLDVGAVAAAVDAQGLRKSGGAR